MSPLPPETYQVNELFYSIQGEGYWTGEPMAFIRLAGCNLKCPFCDTDYTFQEEMTIEQILFEIGRWPTCKVCLTGGEPLIQKVQPLVQKLSQKGYFVHLETNGLLPVPKNVYWVTWSPKSRHPDRLPPADEVKFLCGIPEWEDIIKDIHLAKEGYLHWVGLQPISEEWKPIALEYCLTHPGIRYSCQVHKTLKGVK